MADVGELAAPTGEITTANFGDILLLGYAGFLRSQAKLQLEIDGFNTSADELAQSQATTYLAKDGLADQGYDIPLTTILDGIARSMAIRGLADTLKTIHGGTFHEYPAIGSLPDHEVTVTRLPGRQGRIHKAQDDSRRQITVTGRIFKQYLGGSGGSLALATNGPVNRHWVVEKLVDPQDFQANVSIQFHVQESKK